MTDLNISGCKTGAGSGIDCWVSQFSIDKYLVTLGTVLTPSQRSSLRGWIAPGKYEEWDILFTQPYYIDTTYSSSNTLNITTGGNFNTLWSGNKIVVKSYKEEAWGRPADEYKVTLSGYIYTPL